MKLRDILPYLYFGNKVKIEQYDCYIGKEEPEQIYYGSPIDVPWYIADYYLYNTDNGEAIFLTIKEKNGTIEPILEIAVVENLKNATSNK